MAPRELKVRAWRETEGRKAGGVQREPLRRGRLALTLRLYRVMGRRATVVHNKKAQWMGLIGIMTLTSQ
jgi:hypothetical protein